MQSHHYTLLSVEFTITSYSQKERKKKDKDIYLLPTYFIIQTTSCICFIAKNQIKISDFKVSLQITKPEVSGFYISNATHIVTAQKTLSLSLPEVETFPNDMHLKATFQSIQECIFKLSTDVLILDTCVGSQNYYFSTLHTLSKNPTSIKKNPTYLKFFGCVLEELLTYSFLVCSNTVSLKLLCICRCDNYN